MAKEKKENVPVEEAVELMVEFNGRMISRTQFLEEQEKAMTQKGMKIVEVSPGVYKTRIQE